MSWRLVLISAVLALGLAAAAPAKAKRFTPHRTKVLTHLTVADLQAVLEKRGFPILDTGVYKKHPVIVTRMKGHKAIFIFYRCKKDACATIKLVIPFASQSALSLETINAWNATKPASRAYLKSERDAAIEADLDLEGGITPSAVISFVANQNTLAGLFDTHLKKALAQKSLPEKPLAKKPPQKKPEKISAKTLSGSFSVKITGLEPDAYGCKVVVGLENRTNTTFNRFDVLVRSHTGTGQVFESVLQLGSSFSNPAPFKPGTVRKSYFYTDIPAFDISRVEIIAVVACDAVSPVNKSDCLKTVTGAMESEIPISIKK